MPLKPCPYRHVNDDGLMLCRKINTGDRAVTSDDCLVCPIAHADCLHLRATLVHGGHPPLLVRYGNGRTEVWHDPTPALTFERAACAARVIPLDAPSACTGCTLRAALAQPNIEAQVARMPTPRQRVAAADETLPPTSGFPANVAASASLEPDAARPAAGRIIQFKEWRTRRLTCPPASAKARAHARIRAAER